MKEFSIWTEGYVATGDISCANYHGKFNGETFRDAVEAFANTLSSKDREAYIDMEKLSFWGCRFFDNESDARKAFG